MHSKIRDWKGSMHSVYAILLLLMSLASCNSQDAATTSRNEVAIALELKGSSTAAKDLKPPNIVLLADMPKPRKIEVPAKSGSYFLKNNHTEAKLVELELPAKTRPTILYNIEKLTTDEGLSMDAIHGGTFDRAGNLWVGTDGVGASKYNGQFTNYTPLAGIPHGVVWRVLEDKAGNLWFATDGGGIAKYDGYFFSIYTTEQGLASNYLRNIFEDSAGNLWFSTYGGGISKYDGKMFTNYTTAEGLANDKVFGIAEDKNGNLWLCTDGGVSKFDGKSFVNYTTEDGLASNHIRSILIDRNGNFWFGTDQWGVSKYNGKDFITYTTNDGLPDNVIWSIMEDKRGHIWFGTDVGASEYDGKTFTTYSKDNGFTSNSVRYILEDKQGNIWFLTVGSGILKYSGEFITNYIMKNYVRSVVEDQKGHLWFSTEGSGVFEYDGTFFTNYTLKQGLGDNGLEASFKDRDGNLWFGSQEGGVSKYDGKSFTTYTTEQGLPDNWIWNIQQDKNGHFWFCTDKHGVSKFDGTSFTNYTTEQGLASNHIRSCMIDRNENIWFTTDGGGVSRFDGKVFTNYSVTEGLIDNLVWSIFEDEVGNIWISSMKRGFTRFDGSTFVNYNVEDGLPDNSIVNFALTQNNKLAIGTETGLAILEGFAPISSSEELQKVRISWQNPLKNEELKNYKPVFEVYNTKRGYPIKDVNAGQNAMYLDSKGIFWIGTGSVKTSLVRMNYSALNRSENPPNLLIQKLKINNESVIWSDLRKQKPENLQQTKNDPLEFPLNITEEVLIFGNPLSDSRREEMLTKFEDIQFNDLTKFTYTPSNLQLPHSKNNIIIEFGAIEPALPGDVLYQYKLEGYDKEWSPLSNSTQVTLGNLFEGNYSLNVRALSPFGVQSQAISYPFTILPPWYRTWWAYALYAISAFSAIYLFLRWRTQLFRMRQKELQHQVALKTAELADEKKKADNLLLNILPFEVAEELKEKGGAKAQYFEAVTILFADFKNFTKMTEQLTAEQLVEEIDCCFKAFDVIISRYNIEKIKTIGDSYMAAGGLPIPNTTHAKDVVNAAIEMLRFIKEHNEDRKRLGKEAFEIRIGINTGPVIAGVVGSKKFAYDIWGDAVNMASRMESSGEGGHINVSDNTYQLVKNDFTFTYRGKIAAKGKGQLDMYFVKSKA